MADCWSGGREAKIIGGASVQKLEHPLFIAD